MTGYMEALGHNPRRVHRLPQGPEGELRLPHRAAPWPQDYATDRREDHRRLQVPRPRPGIRHHGLPLRRQPTPTPPHQGHRGGHGRGRQPLRPAGHRHGHHENGRSAAPPSSPASRAWARASAASTAAYIDDVDWGLTGSDAFSVFADESSGRSTDDRAHFASLEPGALPRHHRATTMTRTDRHQRPAGVYDFAC